MTQMMMRTFRVCGVVALTALFVLGGPALVFLGVELAQDAPGAEYTGTPECDDQVMSPGDHCLSTEPDNSGSYEDIVARREDDAQSDAWIAAEVAVGAGMALSLLSMWGVVHTAQLSRRATAAVTLPLTTAPLTAAAVELWHLQRRTEAVSPVPVGALGEYWTIPYTSVLAGAVVAGWTVCVIVVPHSPEGERRWQEWATARRHRAFERQYRYDQRRRQNDERRARAQHTARQDRERFDSGETDDPWIARRGLLPPVPSPSELVVRRASGVLGSTALLFAGVLTVESWSPVPGAPDATPGLAALAGCVLVAAGGVNRPYGAWPGVRWGLPGLLCLLGAASAALTLTSTSWSGLFTTTVFATGGGALAAVFGETLPRPALAGRVLFTLLGQLGLLLGARLVAVATVPASHGNAMLAGYAAAGIATFAAWGAFDTARKTESQRGIPRRLSAACHAATAAVLLASAGYVVTAGAGVIPWLVAGWCAFTAGREALRARGHVRAADHALRA